MEKINGSFDYEEHPSGAIGIFRWKSFKKDLKESWATITIKSGKSLGRRRQDAAAICSALNIMYSKSNDPS